MNNLMAGMSHRLAGILGSPDAGHSAALEQLHSLAYREASTMAYADAFKAILVAFVIATFLVLFMRKVGQPPTSPADAH